MYSRDNLLFIQGPEKTGTSSMNGMLNAHPEILNLFEVYMHQTFITKYGSQVLDTYPAGRRFFSDCDDFGQPYLGFFNWFTEREPEFRYKYVGTKINSLNPFETQQVYPYKVIFTFRDVRSWVLKESIVNRYRTDLDLVAPVISYLKYIVGMHDVPNAFRIRMEDMVLNNSGTFDQLGKWLEIDFSDCKKKWWTMFGSFPQEDPKSMFQLKHVHHSSRIQPGELDTFYKISQIPFWFDVADIFDKYFRIKSDEHIPEKVRAEDLRKIDALADYAPLTMEQCFDEFDSFRLGDESSKPVRYSKTHGTTDANVGIFKKLTRKVYRKSRTLLGRQL